MYNGAEPPEVSTPNRYRLRVWRHQLIRSIERLYWCGVSYINPKTGLSGAFVSLHFVYNWCQKWDPWTLNIITIENGTIAPLLGGDFVQGLPSSPSGEVSMAAGAWERSEDVGYRVRLARAGDTPSSRVKSDRRPGNGGGLVDLGHPVVSESDGFTPMRRGDALPSSIGVEARSTSRRGGYAAGVSSSQKPLVMPGS